jgi:cytochrome c-type biogenesis protein
MLLKTAEELTPYLAWLVFTEGILSFISPCIFPMLPVYLMYLGGNAEDKKNNNKRLLLNTLGFIAGFTTVFVILGATASALGQLLREYQELLQRASGIIMIIFGLHFMGVLKLKLLNRTSTRSVNTHNLKFFTSMIFGFAFSFGWTPCLGPFLGSALLLASQTGTLYQGVFLLLLFSLGLGIPFLIMTMLFPHLKILNSFIRKHMETIKKISAALLILIGLLLALDLFGYYQGLFS